jgi:hypothetical protein
VVTIMRHGATVALTGLAWALAVTAAGRGAAHDEVTVLDDRFGCRVAPILLLARPDVQQDLKLDAQQILRARTAIARLIERGLLLKNQSGPAVVAGRKAIDDDMASWLVQHLKLDQRDRLHQVSLQWEGPSAMVDRPLVAEYLSLSADQQSSIARVLAERDSRRAQGGLTTDARERFTAQALAILSREQKEQWDRLLGPPCRFSIGGPSTRVTRHPVDPAARPGHTVPDGR